MDDEDLDTVSRQFTQKAGLNKGSEGACEEGWCDGSEVTTQVRAAMETARNWTRDLQN